MSSGGPIRIPIAALVAVLAVGVAGCGTTEQNYEQRAETTVRHYASIADKCDAGLLKVTKAIGDSVQEPNAATKAGKLAKRLDGVIEDRSDRTCRIIRQTRVGR